MKTSTALRAIAAVAGLTLLAGCSNTQAGGNAQAGGDTKDDTTITVLSHDSFDFPKKLLKEFHKDTGITVRMLQVGDGGELANKLVLTADAPLGDVVYGLDNTVSYRLKGHKVIANSGVAQPDKKLAYSDEPGLVAIDHGQVCVNYDKTWFENKQLTPPKTLDDLVKPEYRDQLVAMSPTSSTPGMAFLLATIRDRGEDGWVDFWKQLSANGMKITDGWSDAFSVDYSAGEGKGKFPMMVSYGSSPAYSVNDAGTETSTGALLDTCYPQVEYAGVLNGSKKQKAAKKFVEFLLTPKVQEAISEITYMFPANPDAKAPETLTKFGPLSDTAETIPADKVSKRAEEWLRTWQKHVVG